MRADRSRAAVVDALLSFYADGVVAPGAAAIAERAGVSERSVFRHFDDLDSLASATMERELERSGPLFSAPEPRDTLPERVAVLVAQRVALHESMGVIARAAVHHASQSPVIADALRFRRKLLRDQVGAHFADDIAAVPTSRRVELLDALEACSSIEFFDYLCTVRAHTTADAGRIVERTLLALLGGSF